MQAIESWFDLKHRHLKVPRLERLLKPFETLDPKTVPETRCEMGDGRERDEDDMGTQVIVRTAEGRENWVFSQAIRTACSTSSKDQKPVPEE